MHLSRHAHGNVDSPGTYVSLWATQEPTNTAVPIDGKTGFYRYVVLPMEAMCWPNLNTPFILYAWNASGRSNCASIVKGFPTRNASQSPSKSPYIRHTSANSRALRDGAYDEPIASVE